MVGVVLESDAAEQEREVAGHVRAVGEEVGCVRDKGDEARLDLWVEREGVLERERGKEAKKAIPRVILLLKGRKDANTVEDRADVDFRAAELAEGLVHGDSDRII